MIKNEIYKKIDKKKIVIGIIGLGYVGLPLAIMLSKKRFKILGFDNDKNKISLINKKKSYIERIPNSEIALLTKKGSVYSDFKNISKCDFIIICVPTPLKKNNKPDLSYIKNTLKNIKNKLRKKQVLILESTSYPGTTREEIVEKIDDKFKIGKNFLLAFLQKELILDLMKIAFIKFLKL